MGILTVGYLIAIVNFTERPMGFPTKSVRDPGTHYLSNSTKTSDLLAEGKYPVLSQT